MTAGVLIAAVVLDVSCGDPRWFPHPVRLMGRMITWYERYIRYLASGRMGEIVAGVVLAVGLPALWYAVTYWLIELSMAAHEIIGKLTEVLLAYTALAARDLRDHVEEAGLRLRHNRRHQEVRGLPAWSHAGWSQQPRPVHPTRGG